MQKLFYIKIQRKVILIYLMQKLFLYQYLVVPNSKSISKKLYTFLYITKVLTNFGLMAPLNKQFGF
jgi:hypothetical protein